MSFKNAVSAVMYKEVQICVRYSRDIQLGGL